MAQLPEFGIAAAVEYIWTAKFFRSKVASWLFGQMKAEINRALCPLAEINAFKSAFSSLSFSQSAFRQPNFLANLLNPPIRRQGSRDWCLPESGAKCYRLANVCICRNYSLERQAKRSRKSNSAPVDYAVFSGTKNAAEWNIGRTNPMAESRLTKSKNSLPQKADDRGGDIAQRYEPLRNEHMPKCFSISLDAYRKGGTDRFMASGPVGHRRHPMNGFEETYTDIVDYIVRITHRIWEEKNIGYIYDTYSHDCRVWDDVGMQYGRDKIVADTVHTNNAFPDIRLVADEVIWAGDEIVGFHTSHRTMILGTNTGFSRFGAPTGKAVRLFCIANCVSRHNEIYLEHVQYDSAGMLKQLGLDVAECAREAAAGSGGEPVAPNFMASEPARLSGQGKPATMRIPDTVDDIGEFVKSAFHAVWNRRDLSVLDRLYAPSVVMEGPTGRVYRGVGQIKSFALSMLAMFPNLAMQVEDIYWMGNPKEGFLVSARWGAVGSHRGNGPYGPPTGRETYIWGITQWQIKNDRVQRDWTMFNEFGILMQILGQAAPNSG